MISRADRLMQNNKGGEGLRISQWYQKFAEIAIFINFKVIILELYQVLH